MDGWRKDEGKISNINPSFFGLRELKSWMIYFNSPKCAINHPLVEHKYSLSRMDKSSARAKIVSVARVMSSSSSFFTAVDYTFMETTICFGLSDSRPSNNDSIKTNDIIIVPIPSRRPSIQPNWQSGNKMIIWRRRSLHPCPLHHHFDPKAKQSNSMPKLDTSRSICHK